MPEHLHCVVQPLIGTLSTIVGLLKSRTTKSALKAGLWQPGDRLWQRSFWDVLIVNESHLDRACAYVRGNPARRWEKDERRR